LPLVAAITAPDALGSTSWAFVLPYMTILAITALGQMLVVACTPASTSRLRA
jgi:hypothetical protein